MTTPAGTPRRPDTRLLGRWQAALAVLLLVVCGVGLTPWGAQVHLDGPCYLSGAEGIARGLGYRYADIVGHPPISTYPPLHSAVLSLAYRVGPDYPANQPLLRGLMLLLSAGGMALLFRALAVRGVPAAGAAGLVAAVAAGSTWTAIVANMMSEPLFLVLVGLMAWWCEPGRMPTPDSPGATRWWLGLGILAGLMYLARSAAVGIVVGIVLAAGAGGWWRRPRAVLAFALPLGVLASAWILMPKLASGGYGAYVGMRLEELGGWRGYLGFVAARGAEQFGGRAALGLVSDLAGQAPFLKAVAAAGLSTAAGAVAWAASLAATGLVLVGLWRDPRPGDRPALAVVVVYLLQLVAWPFAMGPRASVFLLPWLGAWAWRGWRVLGGFRHPLPWAAVILAVVGSNLALSRSVRNAQALNPCAGYRPVAEWLRRTDPDALVARHGNVVPYELAKAIGRPVAMDVTPPASRYQVVPPSPRRPRYAVVVGAASDPLVAAAPVVFTSPPYRVVALPDGPAPGETRR